MKLSLSTMLSFVAAKHSAAFIARQTFRTQASRAVSGTATRLAAEGQAEVVLVGCGAPNRGKSIGLLNDGQQVQRGRVIWCSSLVYLLSCIFALLKIYAWKTNKND